MKIPLGLTVQSKKTYNFVLPPNVPQAKNNIFLLGKQGVGKTNVLSLIIFYLITLYHKSKGKFGCIPIIFAPLFEYSKLNNKSLEIKGARFPPDVTPKGIESLHFSFRLANIPPYLKKEIKILHFGFHDLTTEEIGVFAGLSNNEDALGKIEKVLEKLKKENPNYSVDDFLRYCKPDKPIYNSLYYIFKRLKESGLFDETAKVFNWFEVLQEKKPICFHFGEIDDENIYQAIAGILMRTLFKLSAEYVNAVYKSQRGVELTERQKWMLDNFVIGLIFEDAHMFFPPTTTNVLRSFPAHKIYKLISMAVGRKRNFKLNFLVSQNLSLIYHAFRTEFDYIMVGSKIDAVDKGALMNLFKKIIPSSKDCAYFVSSLCANNDFEFTLTNMNTLNNVINNLLVEEPPIAQFKAFLSPCAQ